MPTSEKTKAICHCHVANTDPDTAAIGLQVSVAATTLDQMVKAEEAISRLDIVGPSSEVADEVGHSACPENPVAEVDHQAVEVVEAQDET